VALALRGAFSGFASLDSFTNPSSCIADRERASNGPVRP
jgi:hypothetical protein